MNPATGVVFQYKPREGAEELIYQHISDITISMKALDYLHMPDCVPIRYEVEMNTEERKLYDTRTDTHRCRATFCGWEEAVGNHRSGW